MGWRDRAVPDTGKSSWRDRAELADAPADTARTAADSGEALLTNLPAKGFGQNFVRGLPATAGAIIGGAAGVPLGPAGVVAGATIGGAAGESLRQAVSQGTAAVFPEQNYPVASGREVLRDVAIQGAAQGVGQAVGLGIGAAARAVRPFVNKVGAQVMRVGAGIPEKAGFAAMKNPSVFLDAPSEEAAGQAYQSFQKYTGLKGLGDDIATQGVFPTEGKLEEILFGAAQKATNKSATPQELFTASQAASNLKQLGKLGNPRYAMLERAINIAKNTVDDALEAVYPEYQSIRSGYAQAKTAGEFSSLLPLNKNTTPNVLRGVTAATAAGAGVMSGNPAALAALPLVSPKFYGAALKTAAVAGRIPAGVYQMAPQSIAGAGGSSLADAYMRTRNP